MQGSDENKCGITDELCVFAAKTGVVQKYPPKNKKNKKYKNRQSN